MTQIDEHNLSPNNPMLNNSIKIKSSILSQKNGASLTKVGIVNNKVNYGMLVNKSPLHDKKLASQTFAKNSASAMTNYIVEMGVHSQNMKQY